LKPLKLVYIISEIDKSLAFEWIATHLNAEKFSLSFILLNPSSSLLEEFLLLQKFNVKRIKCSGKKDWPTTWGKLCFFLQKLRPDIVHCHLLTASILGLSAAKFVGVKQRIYTRHHSDYHFRYFPKGVKWDRWCNRLSNAVKNILVQMENVPETKVSIVFHGFDFDYFRNVPTEVADRIKCKYNPNDRYPVVGVISRFTELKGIDYIVPAFRQILAKYPNALLLLFNANGDYKQQIELLLATDLPATSFKAVSFESELAAVYRLFDVFVQASIDTNIESFGQTYIEALASEVPSVFTLAGVAPDFIIHQENAIVVPFKNSDAIKQGIIEILENDELRNKIIKGGWNSVRDRFSLHGMIGKLTKVYCQEK
jgi:glycosyltransferase involved in cell wall biosynthesis